MKQKTYVCALAALQNNDTQQTLHNTPCAIKANNTQQAQFKALRICRTIFPPEQKFFGHFATVTPLKLAYADIDNKQLKIIEHKQLELNTFNPLDYN